jgi:hypothetical protein
MKKVIYAMILPLVVMSGLVFANGAINHKTSSKPSPKALEKAARENRKKWLASPFGIKYRKWEASPEGKKVHKSAVKIRKQIINFTPMEAVVTSLSRPAGSPGDFGVIVRINNEHYLLNFNIEKFTRIVPWLILVPWNNEFQQLRNLKVNDKIIIQSHGAGAISNFPYLNILGDYVERNGQIIYKRPTGKGC